MNSSKIAYRPEIDGLRAIAVISVIFYHAQIEFLSIRFMKGGFFGVDIFFIISGYLITRIILFEIKNNNFSILKFYMRRARRILPMLYTIIIASIPFAWQKLLPFDFILYAKSIFASLFFSSNFFFYFSSIQYATESALLKPLLHTWSLGIEEQFYLIFPILTILCYKFFRQFYFLIITILFLLSLCFAQSIVIQNPNFNFYLLFSRFWELAAGSMLAYRELNYNSSKKTNRNYMFSILGLILIIWSILFFDNMTPHPSLYTVLPIIGTVLIVRFSTKNSLVTKLLSIKPLVFVGLISYSAYLWHYPIFAFSRMGGPLIIYDKIFLIILTIIFSIISFFFIEKPFRNPKKITNKVFLKLLFFFTVCIITFSFFIIKTDGFKNRIKNTIAENMSDVEWNKLQKLPYKPLNDILVSKEKNNLISSCYKKKGGRDGCIFGKVQFITVGDSFVGALEPTLLQELYKRNMGLQVNHYPQCAYLSQKYLIHKKDNSPCIQINKARDIYYSSLPEGKTFIVFHSPSSFRNMLSSNKSLNNANLRWDDHFNQLEQLISFGHKVVFIYGVPKPKINSRTILNQLMVKEYKGKELYGKQTKYDIDAQYYNVKKKLKRFDNNNKFIEVDVSDIVCEQEGLKRCFDFKGGLGPIYNNKSHFSYLGAKLVVNKILEKLSID